MLNSTYTPLTEGKDHINIYSRSRSKLGKLLSNLAETPIYHPKYGYFSSIENFWYWYGTGKCHHHLKTIKPFEAKKQGIKYPKVLDASFEMEVRYVLELKLVQHPQILNLFIENKLPLAHYYFYGDNLNDVKVIVPKSTNWLLSIFNELKNKYSKPRNRVIIAGSRSVTSETHLLEAIALSDIKIDEIVSGHARGADTLGEHYAAANRIPIRLFIPDWEKYQNRAGILRNEQMGQYADMLIALWDGQSSGTKHMIEYMKSLSKPVFVHTCNTV